MGTQTVEIPKAPPAALAMTTPSPLEMLNTAVQRGDDVEKLGRLMELYRDWEKNEARKAYVVAMNAFKANAPQITKNETAEFEVQRKSDGQWITVTWDYATLDHIHNQILAALSEHDISHRWELEQLDGGKIRVTCVLTHAQGHSEKASLWALPDIGGSKNAIQAIGSTVMYLQRYTLLAITGLAPQGVDTDGRPGRVIINGNAPAGTASPEIDTECAQLATAPDRKELTARFRKFYQAASTRNDQRAQDRLIAAKEARSKELAQKERQ